jgi:hypothetical protein
MRNSVTSELPVILQSAPGTKCGLRELREKACENQV